ncbi:YqaJ viral recombinase family protein [Gulosibacter massiliensis]|uniref:YqaJ viral recombinase family protein n=1 Tax=Gulosibacter massiliensis TaxID=2479839 RepID=UPI001F496687|nr:YqaJ viral recombinase family protein [Gulosibacter massiliensis]
MNVLEELATREVADESEDREGWLEARRAGITATQVAKLAASPAYALELRREKSTGVQSFTGNAATEWGKRREPIIAEWYSGSGLEPTSKLYRSKDDARFLASPDMIGEDFSENLFLGEIKTSKHNLAPEGEKFRATTYMDQMQWQMFVTGATWCSFIWEQHDDVWAEQSDGSFEPTPRVTRTATIERDDDRIEHLVGVAERFLTADVVVAGTEAWIAEHVSAEAAEKEAKERVAKAKAALRELFPEGGAVETPAGRVSVSVPKSSLRFDQAKFKSEHGDLYKKFQVEGEPGKARVTVTGVK